MNLKKIAIEQLRNNLESQRQELDSQIYHNRWEFKKLREDQTILKRKRAELGKIISLLDKKEKTQ